MSGKVWQGIKRNGKKLRKKKDKHSRRWNERENQTESITFHLLRDFAKNLSEKSKNKSMISPFYVILHATTEFTDLENVNTSKNCPRLKANSQQKRIDEEKGKYPRNKEIIQKIPKSKIESTQTKRPESAKQEM